MDEVEEEAVVPPVIADEMAVLRQEVKSLRDLTGVRFDETQERLYPSCGGVERSWGSAFAFEATMPFAGLLAEGRKRPRKT